jgi:hypothetical protein
MLYNIEKSMPFRNYSFWLIFLQALKISFYSEAYQLHQFKFLFTKDFSDSSERPQVFLQQGAQVETLEHVTG